MVGNSRATPLSPDPNRESVITPEQVSRYKSIQDRKSPHRSPAYAALTGMSEAQVLAHFKKVATAELRDHGLGQLGIALENATEEWRSVERSRRDARTDVQHEENISRAEIDALLDRLEGLYAQIREKYPDLDPEELMHTEEDLEAGEIDNRLMYMAAAAERDHLAQEERVLYMKVRAYTEVKSAHEHRPRKSRLGGSNPKTISIAFADYVYRGGYSIGGVPNGQLPMLTEPKDFKSRVEDLLSEWGNGRTAQFEHRGFEFEMEVPSADSFYKTVSRNLDRTVSRNPDTQGRLTERMSGREFGDAVKEKMDRMLNTGAAFYGGTCRPA